MKMFLAALALLISLPAMTEEAAPKHTVTITLQTPHPGFGLVGVRALRKDGTLHVLTRVVPPPADAMFPMMIGEASVTLTLAEAPGNVKAYVIGRSWNWDDENVTALEHAADFDKATEGGTPVAIETAKPASP